MSVASLSPAALKADFPGLAGGWHYLDTAATAQKPQAVIDATVAAWGAITPRCTAASMRALQR